MHTRPWYDQCRTHEPLRADQYRNPCALCRRYSCVCVPDYYLRLRNRTAFPSDLSTPRGSDVERAFFSAIGMNLLDLTVRLVFADWLDELGRHGEGAILRDRWASPVITPFRVLPYWREAPFFARLLTRQTLDPDVTLLTKRLKIHDQLHGGDIRAIATTRFTRALLLNDEEAVLAGIDRWPLRHGEPEVILRMRKQSVAAPGDVQV